MLYEISKEISTALQAKGVPFAVVYGPERDPASVNETRVVIERDRRATDEFAAPTGRPLNPRLFAVRWQAVQIWIYAQSTLDGARIEDHEAVAEQLVDKTYVALVKCVAAGKRGGAVEQHNALRITSAHVLGADELRLLGLEAWQGVIYEISCAIDRAVVDTTWTAEAPATAKMGGAHGVTIAAPVKTTSTQAADGTLPSVKVDLP